MRKKLLIALCFCFLLYPLSNGRSEEKKNYKLNGYKWANFTMFEKVGFVRGWYEGGFALLSGLQESIYISHFSSFTEPLREQWSCDLMNNIKIVKGFLEESGIDLEGLNSSQIVETIDRLYSDPRVKPWEIKKVMPIVRGRLKEGWTEKDVDEVIAYYIKYSKLSGTLSMLGIEKYSEEYKSLQSNKPKVLKALEAYKYIQWDKK